MVALPRPDVGPGPQRELVDALHDLHRRAGWPSLRVLAREAGCSHTTVSGVFSSPRLPSWGVLELLVEAMDGDVAEFRRLWLAAGTPQAAESTAPLIAGRVRELAVVRRHLQAGVGLLVVTGEAGMGKTRLVTTAASLAAATTFVAVGSCLPLSVDVPLLPVADLLRSTYDRDRGRWLTEALADRAPYVAGSVQRLLPELEPLVDAEPAPEDDWSRQRLFGAIGATLEALASRQPLAVLLEDLHWADAATLDLVEHLLARRVAVPLLGTWRLDDETTPEHTTQWWTRVQRVPTGATLALGLLSRDETAEQLELLTGRADAALVDRIHHRSQGQPLFTEQLAAQTDAQPLPRLLADLLDRRLDGLSVAAWAVARALGVADRALDDRLLAEITGLDAGDLATGLHDLGNRHLLRASTGHRVELGHPLQAEAIRRRLVISESIAEHHRIASALGRSADPSAAEVAEHWQRAEDPAEEVVWRIRAALAAGQRFASAQEAEQWLRVLELWPDGSDEAGIPPVSRTGAYLAAMDALKLALQFDRAAELSEEATRRLTHVDAVDRAALLLRAADFRGQRETAAVGLELLEQALETYATLPPSVGCVQALDRQRNLLKLTGRYDEAHSVAQSAVEAAKRVGVPHLHRRMLVSLAWHQAEAGDMAHALQTTAEAHALVAPDSDPLGDVWTSVIRTDILLRSGGSADEVEAAGEPGLAVATSLKIDNWQTLLLRANISEAMTRAGFVGRAAALIDPVTEGPFVLGRWAVHFERVNLDVLRGRLDAARDRLSALRDDRTSILYRALIETRVDLVNYAALVDLWGGAPERALSLVQPFLDESVGSEAASLMGQTFVLAARAAAGVVEHDPKADPVRGGYLRDLTKLLARARVDPFTTTGRADGAALGASWQAETARLAGHPSLELWAAAAGEWNKLGRPHDAAYCRLRGAQVALASGQGTLALRLLGRATREAREHLPLYAAIAETAKKARRATQSG